MYFTGRLTDSGAAEGQAILRKLPAEEGILLYLMLADEWISMYEAGMVKDNK